MFVSVHWDKTKLFELVVLLHLSVALLYYTTREIFPCTLLSLISASLFILSSLCCGVLLPGDSPGREEGQPAAD